MRHWQAPHPQWVPEAHWPQTVSSYALDIGERLLLFDPLSVPDELLDRDATIVLTAPWHERDSERLGLPLFTPPPDTADDLIAKYGITREQAGDGSPDLAWLRGSDAVDVTWYAAGDRLPFGIDVFPGREHNDLVLWVESVRAVIAGDTLVDFGDGLEINPAWLRAGGVRERVVAGLRPLLDLPIEHVLPTHGEPTDRAALERALA